MVFNVDVGLYIGLSFSLILIIIKSQRARSTILGNIPGTTIYECIDVCRDAKELEGIRIIRYEESLYYANVDNFRYKIMKLSKINPDTIKYRIQKESQREIKSFIQMFKQKKTNKEAISHLEVSDFSDAELGQAKGDLEENKKRITEKIKKRAYDEIENKHIILDCSCMNYMDSQGVSTILQIHEMFKEFGVNLYLSYCKQSLIKSFKKNSFQNGFDFDHIFLTTHDAVLYILSVYRPEIQLIYDNDEKFQNEPATYFDANILKQNNMDALADQDDFFSFSF